MQSTAIRKYLSRQLSTLNSDHLNIINTLLFMIKYRPSTLAQNNNWLQFNSKTYLQTHFNKYLQHNISITTLTCTSRYQMNKISLYFDNWPDLPLTGYAFPHFPTLGKQQQTLVSFQLTAISAQILY